MDSSYLKNNLKENDLSYNTTPVRNDSLIRRKGFDRSLLNPYRVHLDMNSTAINNSSTSTITTDKMPIYSPPTKSYLTIKNPFEQSWLLKEKLSQPVCSPSLFQKFISPIRNSTFSWNIEDISNLRPAQIDENPTQDFASFFSPNTESQAQEAIDRFFSSQQNTLESPVVAPTETSPESIKHVACQTRLTFPPTIPDAIMVQLESISSCFAACSLDESLMNTSSCSARRKLLSDADTGDVPLSLSDEEPDIVSPSLKDESMLLSATPVRKETLSSPELSPINRSETECQSDVMAMSFN